MKKGGGERRRRIGVRFAAFLLLGGILAIASGAPFLPPRPSRYVTDLAAAMPADRAAALNERLAAFERETSDQVLLYVDRRVPEGTTLEEFTNRAFHAWGVGQKGKSNGVVFFLFTDDRKMRMEVGYGLEGALPDARAHRIDAEIIAPLLKAGDVAGALDAGTDAIFAAARVEPYAGTGRTAAEGRRASANNRILVLLLPLLLVGGLFVLIAVLFLVARRKAKPGGSTGWVSSSGSSFSPSSSSSSSESPSASDFSGCGGDSGGGGSSDSY